MSDRIAHGLLRGPDLRVVCCTATLAGREARDRHGLAPSSAGLLAEAACAGLMLASLEEGQATHLNLQIGCDGPIGGLLVDADPAGRVRGYVRHRGVAFPPEPRFRSAPLLGGSGWLSVLRDVNGEYFRGFVELQGGELSTELEHYFERSVQLPSAVQLEVLREGDEPLGWVGGLLVQALPGGDVARVERLREALRAGALERAARAGPHSPLALAEAVLGEPLELLSDQQALYHCSCTHERVLRALGTLERSDLTQMIDEDGKADVGCDFCGRKYHVTVEELRTLLAARTAAAGGA